MGDVTITRTRLLCILAALVVAALGVAVSFDSALVRLDLAVVRLAHRLASTEGLALASAATDLASTTAVLLVGALVAVSLTLRGQWHRAVSVAVSVGATQVIVFGLKQLFERGRPPASSAFVDAAGHAFPSAHAASSVALYGLLTVFVLRRVHGRARVGAVALAATAVGAIGLTRVYLGAHYPSDVVAGWLVGALVAVVAWQLAHSLRRRVAFAAADAGAR